MEISDLTTNEVISCFIGLFLVAMCMLFWSIKIDIKNAKKQKAITDDLLLRSYRVNTKDEVEKFFKEFKLEADKHQSFANRIILVRIEGYLNGLYNTIL